MNVQLTERAADKAMRHAALVHTGQDAWLLQVEVYQNESIERKYGFDILPAREALQLVCRCTSRGVVIGATSKASRVLEGSIIDSISIRDMSFFVVDNPNFLEVLADPNARTVAEYLEHTVAPMLARHGGGVRIADMIEGRLSLLFYGGCQGCAKIDSTFNYTVARELKQRFPFIREVVDSTEHAIGHNPYYRK